MKKIKLKKPYYIGVLATLIQQHTQKQNPHLSSADISKLSRIKIANQILSKPLSVYRSPTNQNRIISTDTNADISHNDYEGKLTILWVGKDGEIIAHIEKTQNT